MGDEFENMIGILLLGVIVMAKKESLKKRFFIAKLFFIFAFLCLSLFLSSCGKSKKNGGNPNLTASNVVIPSTTKVLDEETKENLELVSEDGNILIFKNDTPFLQSLSTDDVIISDGGECLPNGFIRRVASIKQDGSKVVVETTAAGMEDAIQDGDIKFSATLTPSKVTNSNSNLQASAITASVLSSSDNIASLSSSSGGKNDVDFNYKINNLVIYDKDGNKRTKDDQIRVNGNVSLNINFELGLKIKSFSIKKLSFKVNAKENVRVSVESDIDFVFPTIKKEIKKYKLPKIKFSIYGVPIIFTPELSLNLICSGSLSAGLKVSVTQSSFVSVGFVKYADKPTEKISNFKSDFRFAKPSLNVKKISLEVGVEPQLTLLLYGLVGPYVELMLSLEFEAYPNQNPWWKLYGNLEVGLGFSFKPLYKKIKPKNKKIKPKKWIPKLIKNFFGKFEKISLPKLIDYRRLIAKASSPPSPTTGQLKGTVTDDVTQRPIDKVNVRVYDSKGRTIKKTETLPSGQYSMDLPTGSGYKVKFYKSGYFRKILYDRTINSGSKTLNESLKPKDGPPSDPSGLYAVAVSKSQIDISWIDNSNNEDEFKIERAKENSGSPGNWRVIDTVDANIQSYSDYNRLSDTRYWYRVKAYNSSGNSGYTNTATAKTKADPGKAIIEVDPTSVKETLTRGTLSTKILRIHNKGKVLLNISFITASESWIENITPQSFSVAPGRSQDINFDINGTNLEEGSYSGKIKIRSNASNRPKFNIPVSVTVKDTITVTSSPLSVNEGDIVSVEWKILNSSSLVSHSEIHWGTTPGNYTNFVSGTLQATNNYLANFTAPSSVTALYYQVHAIIDGANFKTPEKIIDVHSISPNMQIINFPPNATGNQTVDITYKIENVSTNSISQTDIRWGTSPGNYKYFASSQHQGGGTYLASFTAPSSGTIYFVAYARIDGKKFQTSPENSISLVTASSVQITNAPTNVNGGDTINVVWQVNNASSSSITTSEIHWGSSQGIYPNKASGTPGSGGTYSTSFTAPSSGEVHFVAYVIVDGIAYDTSSQPNKITVGSGVNVEVVNYTSNVGAGNTVSITWKILGAPSGSISHNNVHWGTASGACDKFSDGNKIGSDKYSTSFKTPSSTGTLYFVVHTIVSGTNYYSQEKTITVSNPISIQVTNYPTSVNGGNNLTINWKINNSSASSISHTNIHWGTISGKHYDYTPNQSGAGPYSVTFKAPSKGTIYFVAHGVINGKNIYSPQFSVSINPIASPPIIQVTNFPSSISAGNAVSVSWKVTNIPSTSISNSNIHWGMKSNQYTNYTSSNSLGGGNYSTNFTAPTTSGVIYFKVYVSVNGQSYYSSEYTISVNPSAADVQLISSPTTITGGKKVTITWKINNVDLNAISHSNVHWGMKSGIHSYYATGNSVGNGLYSASFTAPSSGTIYFKAHIRLSHLGWLQVIVDKYSEEKTISIKTVTPPSIQIVNNPTQFKTGDIIKIYWKINNASSSSITINGIRWGTSSNQYRYFTSSKSLGGNSYYANILAPSSGSVYFMAYARVNGIKLSTSEKKIRRIIVNPPSLKLISYPASVSGGGTVKTIWKIENASGSAINHNNVHWGTSPGAYNHFTPSNLIASNGIYSLSFTAPSSGYIYFAIHARVNGKDFYTPEKSIKIYAIAPTISVTSYPIGVYGGGLVKISWKINNTSTNYIGHNNIHWGTSPGYYNRYAYSQYSGGGYYSASFTAPSSGAIYFKVHAIVNGTNSYSSEYSIKIYSLNNPASILLLSYPLNVNAGNTITINWKVNNVPTSSITHINIHWGTSPGALSRYVSSQAGGGQFSSSFTAPSSGTVYFTIHVIANGKQYFTPERSIGIIVPSTGGGGNTTTFTTSTTAVPTGSGSGDGVTTSEGG